jgi:hypothetical protein
VNGGRLRAAGAREDSMRPRRLISASWRPLNFTVRRRGDGHHAARRTATTGEAPACVPSTVPVIPGDL